MQRHTQKVLFHVYSRVSCKYPTGHVPVFLGSYLLLSVPWRPVRWEIRSIILSVPSHRWRYLQNLCTCRPIKHLSELSLMFVQSKTEAGVCAPVQRTNRSYHCNRGFLRVIAVLWNVALIVLKQWQNVALSYLDQSLMFFVFIFFFQAHRCVSNH